MATLQGALIGFGRVAEAAHVPAWSLRRGFRIVAVADDRPERLRAAARCLPGVRAYATAEALLEGEPGIDFVDIATPPHLHARQALLALERGRHVLCEKPLALTPEESDAVGVRARAADRTVFCVHNWAYAPIFRKAFELLRSGAVGIPRHAELHCLRREPAAGAGARSWRTDPRAAGGGILVDHGWHHFYLLRRLIGTEPRAVCARLVFASGGGVEREALCSLEFPGATAVAYLTWRAAERANWGVVHGTEGTLELRDDALWLRRAAGEARRFEFEQKLSQGSAHPDWFAAMLEDFESELATPSLRGRNLLEAETCLSLLAAAYESHRTGGKTVSLPRREGFVHA